MPFRLIGPAVAVLLAFGAFGLSADPCFAASAPVFPELTGRVVDQAQLLMPADESELTSKLESLEAKSFDQLVVVTVPSLQGYPIEDFGYQLGRKWALGQKKVNNGLLLIVAPNERKVRIEVGYGTEGVMPDALASNIITGTILPHFRRGDFTGGIIAGVNDISDALLLDPAEVAKRAAGRNPVENNIDITPYVIIAIWIAIVVFMIWRSRQEALNVPLGADGKRRRRSPGAVIVPGGWGSSGGWSSGSGGWSSGGGSSGGWSGGGGGSFGGGGSSGSW